MFLIRYVILLAWLFLGVERDCIAMEDNQLVKCLEGFKNSCQLIKNETHPNGIGEGTEEDFKNFKETFDGFFKKVSTETAQDIFTAVNTVSQYWHKGGFTVSSFKGGKASPLYKLVTKAYKEKDVPQLFFPIADDNGDYWVFTKAGDVTLYLCEQDESDDDDEQSTDNVEIRRPQEHFSLIKWIDEIVLCKEK